MTGFLWLSLMFLLVPVQVTILNHLAIGDIRPDLCLALACMIGFYRGEAQGLLVGLSIGFVQDLASADQLWLNMLTKGFAGLISGIIGRHLVRTTPLAFLFLMLSVSSTAGLLFLFVGRPTSAEGDILSLVRSALLPQAAYDAVAGAILCWLAAKRLSRMAPDSESSARMFSLE